MQQLQQGTTLQNGKYTIVRVLGQGGFGITYLAEQTMLNRKVAIKEFFLKDLCARKDGTSVSVTVETQADMVERYKRKFTKEAQILARFDHPNIVHVLDIFQENQTWYYVMDYVEGRSLDAIIREKGHLSEDVSLNYIRKIAEALKYIHGFKVNHLDIKPSNIMVRSRDNEPILIDFGISKQYDEKKNETTTTPPGISEGYSPMEQYKAGGVSSFSPQADIYALGATLYKMLTGKTPPSASDILNDGMPKVEGVSAATLATIDKAMQPKKTDRPESIASFLALLKGEPPLTGNDANDETTIIVDHHIDDLEESKKTIIQELIDHMVFVEGGTFTMGGKKTKWYEYIENWREERPRHEVTLSNFSIGKYEVTQREWQAVMGSNPSEFKGDNRPVENVSWDDCQAFIRKLNQMTGRHFRLPTEAEWEYAARGGNRSKGYKYAGSNSIDNVAWYEDNSSGTTHDVGTKQSNELGLYDMSGNVWEWCQDWYGSYSSSAQTNPRGASSGSSRVLRGGSWGSLARCSRVSSRGDYAPDDRIIYLGLRLAL